MRPQHRGEDRGRPIASCGGWGRVDGGCGEARYKWLAMADEDVSPRSDDCAVFGGRQSVSASRRRQGRAGVGHRVNTLTSVPLPLCLAFQGCTSDRAVSEHVALCPWAGGRAPAEGYTQTTTGPRGQGCKETVRGGGCETDAPNRTPIQINSSSHTIKPFDRGHLCDCSSSSSIPRVGGDDDLHGPFRTCPQVSHRQQRP